MSLDFFCLFLYSVGIGLGVWDFAGVSDLDEVSNMCGEELQVWFNFALRNIVFVSDNDCVHEDFVGCVYVFGGLYIVKNVFYFIHKVVPVCFPVVGVAS